ncbi:hypothetical protein AX14_009297 [Amanita brunnescens Koide BX004]|nr:hypothetical protein AX14_009297 [Amanita brunnescens Koide BX004]
MDPRATTDPEISWSVPHNFCTFLVIDFIAARPHQKPLPLNTPTAIELQNGQEITLTLIDANHCPGAVMYLIEGDNGAILHTGDFRAEQWFLDNLARNPFLQPYLAPLSPNNKSFVNRTLDAIYLDTACAFSTLIIPSKEQATTGLVELIKLYPSDTLFFINSWTWGYEDILKSISRAFQCLIHVDRYKYSVYQHVSDPYLRSIVTMDAAATRFHACERFHRCEHVASDAPRSSDTPSLSRTGKHIVYVNPVTIAAERWDKYLEDTKERLRTGETVNTLLVPLSRHSTLPELRSFVNLFKPRRVIPNTLDPRLRGLDWLCLDRMFECTLSSLGATDTIPPTPTDGGDLDLLLVQVDEEGDAAVKNVVGCSDLAKMWADGTKLGSKLEIMVGYLDPERKSFLDKLLRLRPDSPMPELHSSKIRISSPAPAAGGQRDYDRDSEDESDGGAAEDDHWRTAHMLFGNTDGAEGEQFKWAFPSPKRPADIAVSQEQDTSTLLMPELSPIRQIADDRSSQGRMLHISNQHVRRLEDRPPIPRFRVVENHVLESPICAARVAEQRSPKFGLHGYSGRLASNERAEVPLSTSNNHENTLVTKMRSSFGSQCRVDVPESSSPGKQDENVFIQDPFSATPPDRSAPLERSRLSRQASRRSPRRLATLTPTPDTSAGATSSRAETPSTIARRRQRVQRTLKSLELADRLARANPSKVASTYGQKRARLLKECIRSEVKNQFLEGIESSRTRNVIPDPHFDRSLSKFEPVDGTQMEIDWDRSRQIGEQVRNELAGGRWPIFPSLVCTESQPPAS